MDNEMIERCARAIGATSSKDYNTIKIIIKAMREPTEKMINLDELPYSPGEMKFYWWKMIDCILND